MQRRRWRKIRRTAYSYTMKAKCIRVASMPKGLYGCEGAPACEAALAKFRSAIARTVAPPSVLASVSQVFLTSSYGKDLDPEINIYHRMVTMLRRMTCKHAEVRGKVASAAAIYMKKGLKGCHGDECQLDQLQPCPAVGQKGRKMETECPHLWTNRTHHKCHPPECSHHRAHGGQDGDPPRQRSKY